MVGATGIEPATFSSRTRRATRLRYAPLWAAFYLKELMAQEAIEKKLLFFAELAGVRGDSTAGSRGCGADGGHASLRPPYGWCGLV